MEYSVLKKLSHKNIRSLSEILSIVKGREDGTELYDVVLEDLENKVSKGYSIRKYEKIISGEIANYLALIGVPSFLSKIDYNDLDDDLIVQIVVNHNNLFTKANKIVKFSRSQLLTILVSDPNIYLMNKINPDSRMLKDFITITGRYDLVEFDRLGYEELIQLLKVDRRILNFIPRYNNMLPKLKYLNDILKDINFIDRMRVLYCIWKYRLSKRLNDHKITSVNKTKNKIL